MKWIRGIVGVVLVLVGLAWIGQGANMIPGSFMSGQPIYAVLGLIVAGLGAWLLWGLRGRSEVGEG